MSVEARQYPYVKVEPPSKKMEYAKPKNWAVANKNNNRLSQTQVWRR